MKTTTYFAYGSNLNQAQMRRRCPHARLVKRATLHGYRLGFAGHSRTWGGAVATIARGPSDQVAGVIYELPRDELDYLDQCEGHPFVYLRRRLCVVDETGRVRRPHIYVKTADDSAFPSRSYFETLWVAYRRLGFEIAPLFDAIGVTR